MCIKLQRLDGVWYVKGVPYPTLKAAVKAAFYCANIRRAYAQAIL